MSGFLPYNRNLKQNSRDLRNHSTLGEVKLWTALRTRSMMGYEFYRQKPLLNYIVDFYSNALKLVIEIDGGYHNNEEVVERDAQRQKEIEAMGLNFLRFTEEQATENLPAVLLEIENYILKFEAENPACLPFKQRRRNSPNTSFTE